jgi:hypothetical protein
MLSTVEDSLFRKEIAMTKFRKLITPLLITVIICATLALGYRQDPLRLPNPFSGARPTPEKKDQPQESPRTSKNLFGAGQTQEKKDRPAEDKDVNLRIAKLESKIAQLEKRIDQLQKRMKETQDIPLNQK